MGKTLKTKVQKVGGSLFMHLPVALVQLFGIEKGDELVVDIGNDDFRVKNEKWWK